MEDNDDVVCKFKPQIRVFFNADSSISVEVMEASGQSGIVAIPLECAKAVTKAINAIAKELS